MILETDMAKHFKSLTNFNATVFQEDFSLKLIENKIRILTMALKCADIGHACKEWNTHYKWSMKVIDEFFQQGDMEKES